MVNHKELLLIFESGVKFFIFKNNCNEKNVAELIYIIIYLLVEIKCMQNMIFDQSNLEEVQDKTGV